MRFVKSLPKLLAIAFAPVMLIAASLVVMPGVASAQIWEDRPLRPIEILDTVYSSGFTGATRPRLRGDIYVLTAIDPDGNRVRLFFDAYDATLVDRDVIGVLEAPPLRKRRQRILLDEFASASDQDFANEPQSDAQVDAPPPVRSKRKPSKDVASAAPDDSGVDSFVAPGAGPQRKYPLSEKPITKKPVPKPKVPKLVAAKPKLPLPETALVMPPVQDLKLVAPKLVAPPRASVLGKVMGPPMPQTIATGKAKPRVIPIAPAVDLDIRTPPPPLRVTPMVPPVGLE